MLAFQGAVDLGYRWLETDLRLAADGVVMCIHDATVDRTTGAGGPIGRYTRSELERLDAGTALAGFEDRGLGVPSLEEVLTAFPQVQVTVDLKEDGLEEPLWELLQRLDAVERAVVGSFSGRRLRRFRRVAGGSVLTSAGPAAVVRVRAASVATTPRRVADALQVPERFGGLRVVTPAMVAKAKKADMVTHVWTVNESADMHRLLDWGVDGIITDRPDLLKEVMIARGVWK